MFRKNIHDALRKTTRVSLNTQKRKPQTLLVTEFPLGQKTFQEGTKILLPK